MPKEFYDLWSFCKRQSPIRPEGLIFIISCIILFWLNCNNIHDIFHVYLDAFLSVGLKLVGPYDVLAGHMNEFDTNDVEKTILHWRYYYDPPEFQVCVK